MTARIAIGTLFGLLLGACGGDAEDGPPPNRAPVVDAVDAPDEVTPAGGKYVLQVRVTFHDDDNDTVSQLRMQFPAGGVDQTTPIQQATAVNRSATVGIELIGAPPGTYDYLVSVFDEHGLESAPTTKQLTLK